MTFLELTDLLINIATLAGLISPVAAAVALKMKSERDGAVRVMDALGVSNKDIATVAESIGESKAAKLIKSKLKL